MKYLLGVIVLIGNFSFADSSPAESLVHRLEVIETFQAKFSQTLSDKNGAALQSSEGKIKLQKPGKFYWQVEPPYEQLVVSNGSKLWIYDADLEQATVSPSEELRNTPAEILSGNFGSLRAAYKTTHESKGKRDIYELTPLAESDFASLVFVFKKQNLVEFAIVDKLGQKTSVIFSKAKINKKIEAELFDFIPPEGTDIIVND